MSLPIKTQVMRALETALGAIAEIKSVHRWQGMPYELDTVAFPALYFYETVETRDEHGDLGVGTIDLTIGVFIPLGYGSAKDWHEKADLIQGKIHNALAFLDKTITSLTLIKEINCERGIPNDTYGEITLNYQLTYTHALGDAFKE